MLCYGLVSSLLGSAWSQTSTVTCQVGFDWAENSLGQDPCQVTAYLVVPCSPDGPQSDTVKPLVGNSPTYQTPSPPTGSPGVIADSCTCSSVLYSTIQACALCQGGQESSWKTWITNCTSSDTSLGFYPVAIPNGTAVPEWAYQNVSFYGVFNVNEAITIANQHLPENGNGTNSQPPGNKPNSLLVPIVAGLVGGLAALGVCIIAAALIIRKRRQRDLEEEKVQVPTEMTVIDPFPYSSSARIGSPTPLLDDPPQWSPPLAQMQVVHSKGREPRPPTYMTAIE